MVGLTLEKALEAVTAATIYARNNSLAPMTIAVLNEKGVLKAFVAEDSVTIDCSDVAIHKAHEALAMGNNAHARKRFQKQHPHLNDDVARATFGTTRLVPGGLVIRARDGGIIGAIGVMGGEPDVDHAVASAGAYQAELTGNEPRLGHIKMNYLSPL